MDLSKSLEELENDFWEEPDFKSSLVLTCHRLRKAPLSSLTVENLRILIGQEIGLHYLLPIALNKLEQNILVSGDKYEGDLLKAVASISDKFWSENPALNQRSVELKTSVEQAMVTLSEIIPLLNKREYV